MCLEGSGQHLAHKWCLINISPCYCGGNGPGSGGKFVFLSQLLREFWGPKSLNDVSYTGSYWQGWNPRWSHPGPHQHFFYTLRCLSLQSSKCFQSSGGRKCHGWDHLRTIEPRVKYKWNKIRFHNIWKRQEVLWLVQSFLNIPTFDWQWLHHLCNTSAGC